MAKGQEIRARALAMAQSALRAIRGAARAAAESLRDGRLAEELRGLGRTSLGLRLALVVALGVMVVMGGTMLFVGWRASSTLNTQAVEQLGTALDVGERLLATYDNTLRDTATRMYDTFLAFLPEEDISRVDEELHDSGDLELPALYMGDTLLNNNDDPVDRFELATSGIATVYQRDGDGFVRIATNLRDDSALRATGTSMSQDHPARDTLLAGEPWSGQLELFGNNYIAFYSPISYFDPSTGADDEIVAAFAVAFDYASTLEALKNSLRAAELGEDGYFLAINVREGENFGRLELHPEFEGQRIAELEDVDLRTALESLARGDAKDEFTLRLKSRSGTSQPMIARVRDFKPFGWRLVALESRDAAGAAAVRLVMVIAVIAVIALCVLLLGLRYVAKRLLSEPLGRAVTVVEAVAEGNLDVELKTHREDEIGRLYAAMTRMSAEIKGRMEAERKIAQDNLRIRLALDEASVGMMIADAEHKVIYANPIALRLMRTHTDAIRTVKPDFDPDVLVGSPIAAFSDERTELGKLAAELSASRRVQLLFGEVVLDLELSPVRGADGRTAGLVAEWHDRTLEARIEREISRVVEAAAGGDLGMRMQTADKQGFHRLLAENLNALLEKVNTGVREIRGVLGAMAQGDLSRVIEIEMDGVFGEMKADTNASVERLREIVAQIQAAPLIRSAAASRWWLAKCDRLRSAPPRPQRKSNSWSATR
jgi:methyl-accepting chemotaxis protein